MEEQGHSGLEQILQVTDLEEQGHSGLEQILQVTQI